MDHRRHLGAHRVLGSADHPPHRAAEARRQHPPLESAVDVEWINDAAKPAQLALAPRRAATLAVETARATDQAVAALSDELLAKNAAAGSPINLLRAEHRREHLDEIDEMLRRT